MRRAPGHPAALHSRVWLLRRCAYGARPLTPQMLLTAVRCLCRRPPRRATIDRVLRFVRTRFHLPPPGRSPSAGARDVARKLQTCLEVGVLEQRGDTFLPGPRFAAGQRLCARDVRLFWSHCARLRRRRSQGPSRRRRRKEPRPPAGPQASCASAHAATQTDSARPRPRSAGDCESRLLSHLHLASMCPGKGSWPRRRSPTRSRDVSNSLNLRDFAYLTNSASDAGFAVVAFQ